MGFRLQDVGRTKTVTFKRIVQASTAGGAQAPSSETTLVAAKGSVRDVTAEMRRTRHGAEVLLGLRFYTEDKTALKPGDVAEVTHLGEARELEVAGVRVYRYTQQVDLVHEVKG